MIAALDNGKSAAYCARIGLAALPAADAEGLALMQRAHRLAIPFENLDIMLGRGIDLAPDSVFAKLVTARRGGYCFEQNQLFLRALLAAGFAARPLLARVWLIPTGTTPPRTHSFNLVELGGRPWIADAGFGGAFTPPMPIGDGAEASSPDGARHRLSARVIGGESAWILERHDGNGWADQYSFTLAPVVPADLEMANHWTATAPASRFTRLHIASRVTETGFLSLTDRSFTERADGRIVDQAEAGDAAGWSRLLADRFGIALDPTAVAGLGLFALSR